MEALDRLPKPALCAPSRPVSTFDPGPPPELRSQRVALLVGGPSLKELWSDAHASAFDAVVVVNGAAFLFAHDYALMVDRPIVQKYCERGIRPRKAFVTYEKAHQVRTRPAKLPTMQIPSISKAVKSYSFPRAIVFSLRLAGGAGTIEVFGMDWTDGPTDVAGFKGYHALNRWQQEAEVLRLVWSPQITAVHGRIGPERLAFIRNERQDWPG